MILPRKEDARHKFQMLRLLKAILSDSYLVNQLAFKGGSYAVLRGVLDRFSVDLDFDLLDKVEKKRIKKMLGRKFEELGLEIKDQSKEHLQFFLKYEAPEKERNTLKLEITDLVSPENEYEAVNLRELNLVCRGQSLPTMVANKMYACVARKEKTGKLAGRDFYDLHHFLKRGLGVKRAVIEERSGLEYGEFVGRLKRLVEEEVTERVLYQDLNVLLPVGRMRQEVKRLREELVMLLEMEEQ